MKELELNSVCFGVYLRAFVYPFGLRDKRETKVPLATDPVSQPILRSCPAVIAP